MRWYEDRFGAVALYLVLARSGLLGSLAGFLLAHTLLGIPSVILIMAVALRSLDVRIDQAALTLGARWPLRF